jgi:hypothetical protein
LGAASVLTNLHHRWIIPLMERRLRIFAMEETANPVALACSRLIHDRLPPEYTATRARRAINLKAVKNSNDDRGGTGASHGGVLGRDGGDVGRGLSARRALEEEEAGLLYLEVGSRFSGRPFSRGVSLIFLISFSLGGADRPPLALTKVLRADASIPTRRRSSRAPRVTGSVATATSKAPRSTAAAVESQQVAVATTVVVGAECGPDTNQ